MSCIHFVIYCIKHTVLDPTQNISCSQIHINALVLILRHTALWHCTVVHQCTGSHCISYNYLRLKQDIQMLWCDKLLAGIICQMAPHCSVYAENKSTPPLSQLLVAIASYQKVNSQGARDT